jgi:hypothetical protein
MIGTLGLLVQTLDDDRSQFWIENGFGDRGGAGQKQSSVEFLKPMLH